MNVHKTCFPISSQVMEMYIAAKDEWEIEEVGRKKWITHFRILRTMFKGT